jgi:hypothetical protein
MRRWHDYHLTGYAVEGAQERLIFNLIWPYHTETSIAAATLVFSGVAGYFFRHDLGVNIVASIEEIPLENFLLEHGELFDQEKQWGWPLFWKSNVGDTLAHLQEKEIRCVGISSSYGLTGWILASAVVEHLTDAR